MFNTSYLSTNTCESSHKPSFFLKKANLSARIGIMTHAIFPVPSFQLVPADVKFLRWEVRRQGTASRAGRQQRATHHIKASHTTRWHCKHRPHPSPHLPQSPGTPTGYFHSGFRRSEIPAEGSSTRSIQTSASFNTTTLFMSSCCCVRLSSPLKQWGLQQTVK